MKRVDLGDDSLAPERVRAGEEERRCRAREDRSGELRGHDGDQPACDRSEGRRREIQGARRIVAGRADEEAADGEVERVAIAWRDDRRSRPDLKRRAVAELEARQQRRAVEKEGEHRHGDRRDGSVRSAQEGRQAVVRVHEI
jgi:hypothetical protein